MFFKASLDMSSKLMTTSIALMEFVLIFITFTVLKDQMWIVLMPIFTLGVVLGLTYIYSPLHYEISNDAIEIHRQINKFFIPRNQIVSMSKLTNNEMGRTWRMMGNGGMFGYTGWFHSSSQGKMRWFVSQRKNYISIVLQNGTKYILSPDDVDGFLQSTQW